MNLYSEKPILVDSYQVSPLSRPTESGRYTASVSIRRGTHDRVMRFMPCFATREDALQYATAQGHSWLQQRHGHA